MVTGSISSVFEIVSRICPLNNILDPFSQNSAMLECLFFHKFKKIVYHLRGLLLSKNISPSERYVYARDFALFFFFRSIFSQATGRIKTADIFRDPDGTSLLLHQRVGNTLNETFQSVCS